MVFCLGMTLGLYFFPYLAERVPFMGQGYAYEAPETSPTTGNGIGGASLENADFEVQLASLFAEMNEAEPEVPQRPRLLLFETHSIQSGDLIGNLAINFGLNEDTILSVNNIRNSRLLQIGQVLRIPNQDGIMSSVQDGDTLEVIAERYSSDAEAIRIANQLFSYTAVPGSMLFIPGGRLSWEQRLEINGDLFVWPVAGRITSNFGWRSDPFGSGRREFHNGIDIAARMGTPIRASMAGRVSAVGFDNVLGNFIIITHPRGYRTLYAHLSRVRVRQGAYVGSGQHIGDVGSTGRSTGPHLHFTVFRHGTIINPRTVLR
ncbi:MAG: M23 family metallopeptidase [Treponema sp.]|nr:M23 family metallopeptidase [Treponema sp.]